MEPAAPFPAKGAVEAEDRFRQPDIEGNMSGAEADTSRRTCAAFVSKEAWGGIGQTIGLQRDRGFPAFGRRWNPGPEHTPVVTPGEDSPAPML